MNCQQVQDLMPLYAGGDLEENRARPVDAHVQSCETCSAAARSYRETRQMLQEFVPPTFTDDFYAEMRQSVWQNIEKKTAGPAFVSIIADLFRPRLAWAVATAVLLIAVSVVGFYVIRRGTAPQSVASNEPSTTPATHHEPLPTSSRNDKSSASSLPSTGSKSGTASVHQLYSRPIKHKSTYDRVNLEVVPTVAVISPALISAPEANDLRQPTGGSSGVPKAPLRMEIQTKNPNIRIIWFAPRDAKSSSPNSKGI